MAISVFEKKIKKTPSGGKIKKAIHWGDKEMKNFQMKFSKY